MKNIVLGILAHVDAGKTTLSEALLYHSGVISEKGRVDKGSSFLDTDGEERRRGITIFSSLATIPVNDTSITLLDTPGHVDFACETERALSVEDYAILVISADEGVTPHTKTLWNLLRARGIPTFIFVNKTDIANRRKIDVLEELKSQLSSGVVSFLSTDTDAFFEDCAACSEALMKSYFEEGVLTDREISEAIRSCALFPCFFGSALKLEGTKELLLGIDRFTLAPDFSPNIFGAKVYKIARDPDGARLTYMKITGGSLALKDSLKIRGEGGEVLYEKVEGLRLYSADKYKNLKRAEAGTIVAIPGLIGTRAGMGLGVEPDDAGVLSPTLDYTMILPAGSDVYEFYLKIAPLAEEEPSLSLRYDPKAREIKVRLMGEIQGEILTKMIADRYGVDISFSEGKILYKETIKDTVYGNGHFEPLMHYAEVRLRLEPLPEGSGLVFVTECPTDLLKTNWQRLILSALEGHLHRGVLTGSPITDMKITLIMGKAHPKHTEGGDFRQASIRAVRQGLMKADSVLLEPTFNFEIRVPENLVGRIMTDVDNMYGKTSAPEFSDGAATIRGYAPVSEIRSYPVALRAMSRGAASISLTPGAYLPCHNAEEVISAAGYDPELDRDPVGSVFCAKGAGYAVPWYEVDALMHTENPEERTDGDGDEGAEAVVRATSKYRGTAAEDKELMAIFERTYGKIKPRTVAERVENNAAGEKKKRKSAQDPRRDEYTIIDGYNFIFASEKLKALAKDELSFARDTLVRILSNYASFKKSKFLLVFDAYKRHGGEGAIEKCGNVTVVYTKEAETADAYIERATYGMAKDYAVRVVTSDYSEQLVILGCGGIRITPQEFERELEAGDLEIKSFFEKQK